MRNQGVRSSRKAGFRRLWLVVSVIWVILSLAAFFDHGAVVIAMGVALPPVALYVLGSAVAWVIEGFAKAE